MAGVGSTLPAASVARTAKLWVPAARALYVVGDVHEVKAAPSRLHENVDPTSSDENANSAVVALVVPAGPVTMLVSGGAMSVPSSLISVCQ